MKCSLRPIAALLLVFAGIGSGCAEDESAGEWAYIDGAFLTAAAFYSGPEGYPFSW
ncbi:hypothetical protein [Aromatoleum bremense]|uniref:hypothetical protein n=1 Tax=Aromatoleum bremense TaxID=76115 RepID=UPI00145F57FC|nr:hypothetical protein [Aromatoleum bremense]QTQ30254.1 Uncharacterized protein pbN1_02620 [Aromatoleum bremense]